MESHNEMVAALRNIANGGGNQAPVSVRQRCELAATMLEQWSEKWAAVAKTPTAMAIDMLCANEGSALTIYSSNREGCGPDNEAVEVTDDWTDWEPRRFQGNTLTEALAKACDAMPPQCKPTPTSNEGS